MLQLLSIAVLSCLLTHVYPQCSWGAYGPDRSGILSDVSIPRTLTDVEVYYYSDCTQVATAYKTVYIQGTAFAADPIVFTFANPETPLAITYEFPQVTLTSLSAGEALTYSETLSGTDAAIFGHGGYTVTVPVQIFSHSTPSIPSATVTTTATLISATTISQSTGISHAAVGGIAAGIVAGFVILGGIAAFFILRARPRYDDMRYTANEQNGKWENHTNQNLVSVDCPSGRINE